MRSLTEFFRIAQPTTEPKGVTRVLYFGIITGGNIQDLLDRLNHAQELTSQILERL